VQTAIDAEKTRINDILSDNIADPSEKQYLSNLWQEIYAEYPRIWAQANDYSVDKSNYEAKYTALNNLLSPVLANLTVNSTVSGASIRTAFSEYYDAKTFLLNNITNKVNTTASDAQAKANLSAAITDKFSGFNGGLATAVIMEMREPSTTTRGDATAGISGIQKDINGNFLPAVWAGGTYDEAISGIAKAIIRHDGTSKFMDTDITGRITSNEGVIAGWEFTAGRIGKTQSNTWAASADGLSLYDSFIKFSDADSSVFLGTNVLPASTGMVGMGRITNTNSNIRKIGMYFDMAGADTSFWDGSSNNIAMYINRGVITGAKFNGVNHNLTSDGYTIGEETVVIIYNSSEGYTVYLPANPEAWEFKWITSVNNVNFVLHGNGKNIWSPFSGSVASLTFKSGVVVYTGQEWAYIG
jgi:hypothetical protein